MNKKLLIVVNEDSFFLSHRLRIAELAKEKGWEVTIVAKDTGKRAFIESIGFNFIAMPVNPTGMNPIEEVKLLRFLYKLSKNNTQSVIHFVGLKNMLWGGLASKWAHNDRIVFAVSGLGVLFGEKRSQRITNVILKLLKIGFKGGKKTVIFQNHEDESLFLQNGICNKNQVVFLKGSGVPIEEFYSDFKKNSDKVSIVFAARMLKEKGVLDLIEAAKILRPNYEGKIVFFLCGETRDNSDSLTKEELQDLTDDCYIKWLGYREDIPDILAKSDIMCYPSFYREGLPKCLLEAAAAGLPIITTDSIGCRDVVEPDKNGLLVPPHSPIAIANALERLINDKNLRERMGIVSRKKAEQEFNVEEVANKHITIYERLIADNAS